MGTAGEQEAISSDRQTIQQWERARIALSHRPLYWFADSLDEASLPKGVDNGLAERFHTLMGDTSVQMPADQQAAFEAGHLDALFLSAALGERACAILTLADADGGPPSLVQRAAEIGMTTHQLDPTTIKQVRQSWFSPLFMRAGLLELVAGEVLRLAYLRLAAPLALFSDQSHDDEAHPSAGWLSDAHLFWGPVA